MVKVDESGETFHCVVDESQGFEEMFNSSAI